jgi:hypothetical protein
VSKILDQPCPKDEVAAAYCGANKTISAVLVGQKQVRIEKGKTWVDWAIRGWDTLAGAVPFIGIGYIANKGLESAGRNNYVTADTITDSFNPLENHITGSPQATMGLDFSKPYNLYNGPVTQ